MTFSFMTRKWMLPKTDSMDFNLTEMQTSVSVFSFPFKIGMDHPDDDPANQRWIQSVFHPEVSKLILFQAV